MRDLNSWVAAVTGAAGGIGRAVALELARHGCRIAVSDVDEEGLTETAELLDAVVADSHVATVDVADREQVYDWADEVVDHFGQCNAIVNNAGVSLTASVDEMEYADFEWLMDINFWGVVYGTKAFLPYLRETGDGHVVNISSVFGLIGSPTQSAYNAAKFAVRGFTESLRAELDLRDDGVSATSVHPGGIKTGIVDAGRIHEDGHLGRSASELRTEFENELARTTPEDCARTIVEAVRKNKRRVLVGPDAHLIDIVQRLLPTTYQRFVVREFRKRWA